MGMYIMKIYVIAAAKPLKFDFSRENSKKSGHFSSKMSQIPRFTPSGSRYENGYIAESTCLSPVKLLGISTYIWR